MKKTVAIFILLLSGFMSVTAQTITYSQPEKDDTRILNFEILGKVNGRTLIYKNFRDLHYIAVYDNDMKVIERNKMDFFPEGTRILNTEFLQYPDFTYVIYQYQRRNVLYCMAAKLDDSGKKLGEVQTLDTTENVSNVANRVYSVINSEDKQKIMVFKINSRNDRSHLVTTCLFDRDLKLLKRLTMAVNMSQRNDFLTEFALDNDGGMACIRASGTSSNDNINRVTLITRTAMSNVPVATDLRLNNLYLDDIRIKVDNLNKHYVITSFFSKTRRGNIEGLYYYLWDREQGKEMLTAATTFSDEFRSDARSDGNIKAAFNDYFLKNIILRKDGGFLVIAESAYSTSRGGALNRWDYLYGSPYWSQSDYYSWNSPMGYYPWRTPAFNTQLTRYFADNVAVLSFDPNGKMEWSNLIRKSQYDDNSDNFIGFGTINTGGQIHFLFNVLEKRDMILSDQAVLPSGQITRNPTFKNLERGYEFMPRHAKQIGARQLIVPCTYRGYTCFAKIEL